MGKSLRSSGAKAVRATRAAKVGLEGTWVAEAEKAKHSSLAERAAALAAAKKADTAARKAAAMEAEGADGDAAEGMEMEDALAVNKPGMKVRGRGKAVKDGAVGGSVFYGKRKKGKKGKGKKMDDFI